MVKSLASLRIYFLMLCADKSFDDEESVDGNRPSSAASAFKVPAPKTSGNPVNSGRKPGSAGGPKVGGNVDPCGCPVLRSSVFIHDCCRNAGLERVLPLTNEYYKLLLP